MLSGEIALRNNHYYWDGGGDGRRPNMIAIFLFIFSKFLMYDFFKNSESFVSH